MNENQKPPESQIKSGDVLSQFVVLRTKDNRIAVQFPAKGPTDQTIDAPAALELLAAGLNTMAQILRQQSPDKPKIVLAPARPPEFLTRPRGLKAD